MAFCVLELLLLERRIACFRLACSSDEPNGIRSSSGYPRQGDSHGYSLYPAARVGTGLTAENILIENSASADLRLSITYNPEVGSKTFNVHVHVQGLGPICRLDVDGTPHRPAGRSHKHSLKCNRCPDRDLPDGVVDRPDSSGKSIRELFAIFCEMGRISHQGELFAPDEP